ncbi:MAG: hypothetical protein GEU99_05180 [Luteitalea sp.]|nr:hypothetical protein [Luteitalea sp.]
MIDRQRIEELPLNGRDPLALAALVAGAVSTGGGANKQSSTLANTFYSVNGGRDNTVNFRMDGLDQNDPYTNAASPLPNPDALQEFSLQTSNFDAEYGRSSGAVMNVVAKSGTNELHGSAFEFFRSGQLNARNFFSSGPDSLTRHQFGGSLGGPVVRNRTFFFGSYQGTRVREAPTSGRSFAPTQAQRNGDLSSLGKTIVDPDTGLPFPGGVIPADRLDPGIQQMLNDLVPLPNTGEDLVSYTLPSRSADHQVLAKIDQVLTDAQRLSVRYFQYNLDTPAVSVPGNMFASRNGFIGDNHSLAINHSATLTSRLMNSVDVGFSHLFTDQPVPLSAAVSDYGADIYTIEPKTLNIAVPGYFSLVSSNPVPNRRLTWQIKNTTTYVRGRHLLKMGAEFRHTAQKWDTIFVQNGHFAFSGQLSGDGLADFLLGRPSLFQQASPLIYDGILTSISAFAQDNIRLSNRTTLNAGLRYEPYVPAYFRNDRMAHFSERAYREGRRSRVYPNAPPGLLYAGDDGVPRGGTSSYYKALAPRLGIAHDLSGDQRTVLRGGYGLFWDTPKMILLNRFTTTQPFSLSILTPSPPSFQDPYAGRVNPFPGILDPSADIEFIEPLSLTITWPERYEPSRVHQWNVTLERMLGRNLLRVAYVGTKGSHLNWTRELNSAVYVPGASTLENTNERRPYPEFAGLGRMFQDGRSIYHGLQLTFERRVASGLSATINYTYSKSMDLNSQSEEAVASSPLDMDDLDREWAPSSFDVTHNWASSLLWNIPGHWAGVAGALLNGWQINGIVVLRSGQPFTVFTGLDRQLNGRGGQRPDLIGDPTLPTDRPNGELIARYFNTEAFALNAIGEPGTSGRNILRGPGAVTADVSVIKNIALTSQARLQLRVEAFNVLNRPNFGTPVASMGSPLFGQILSAGEPRILQLSLRATF